MTTHMDKALSKRISSNIRRLLTAKGWKQEEISKRSDLDKGNLSRYFAGTRDYTLLAVQRIAEGLDVDVSELFKK